MRKFPEIIERIEYLRNHLGLNKSRFSAEIGMKPQTYNNFIGSQGSKPNVELLYGIVVRFGVNPVWVFTGQGQMFLDSRGSIPAAGIGVRGREGELRMADTRERPAGVTAGAVVGMSEEMATIEPLLRKVENQIKQLETMQAPLLDRLASVLKRYVELFPKEAPDEIRAMLERMEQRIGEKSQG